jgi:DNA-binding helix-turn-helix protein
MSIGERIKERRKKIGMSAEQVAEKLGVSPATIYRYESNDIANMRIDKLEPIAEVLRTTPAYLMGWEENENKKIKISDSMPVGSLVPVRLIASVRAGYGGLAVATWDGEYEMIPEFMLKGYSPNECVLFKVKGDSMYPRILDGDKIVVHEQSSVDSGDTAIVVYNGDEGTVKKVNYVTGEDWVELIPNNPEYPIRRIEGIDLEECRVYGKVIGLFRDNI